MIGWLVSWLVFLLVYLFLKGAGDAGSVLVLRRLGISCMLYIHSTFELQK